MASIAGIKRDMAILGQGGLQLSPFGLLSQAFAEEIRAHAGGGEGFYELYDLDFLEENGDAPENIPVSVRLYVDLKLVLQQMKERGQSGGAAERIVEKALAVRLAHERSAGRLRRPEFQARNPENQTALGPAVSGTPGPGISQAAYRRGKQRPGSVAALPRYGPRGERTAGKTFSGTAPFAETFHRETTLRRTPFEGVPLQEILLGSAAFRETASGRMPPGKTGSGGITSERVTFGGISTGKMYSGKRALGERSYERTAAGETVAGENIALNARRSGYKRVEADRISAYRPGPGPEMGTRGFFDEEGTFRPGGIFSPSGEKDDRQDRSKTPFHMRRTSGGHLNAPLRMMALPGAEMVFYREREGEVPRRFRVSDGESGTFSPAELLPLANLLSKNFPALPGLMSRRNQRVKTPRNAGLGEDSKQALVPGQGPQIREYAATPMAERDGPDAREVSTAFALAGRSVSTESAKQDVFGFLPAELEHIRESAAVPAVEKGSGVEIGIPPLTASGLAAAIKAGMAQGMAPAETEQKRAAKQVDDRGSPAAIGGSFRQQPRSQVKRFPVRKEGGQGAFGFLPAELEHIRESAAVPAAGKGTGAGIGGPPLTASKFAAAKAGMAQRMEPTETKQGRSAQRMDTAGKADTSGGGYHHLPPKSGPGVSRFEMERPSAFALNRSVGAFAESHVFGGFPPVELEHMQEAGVLPVNWNNLPTERANLSAGRIRLPALEGMAKQVGGAAAGEIALRQKAVPAKEIRSIPAPRDLSPQHPGPASAEWPMGKDTVSFSAVRQSGPVMPSLTVPGAIIGSIGRTAWQEIRYSGKIPVVYDETRTQTPPPLDLEYAGEVPAERLDGTIEAAPQQTPAKSLEALGRQVFTGEHSTSPLERKLRAGTSDRSPAGGFTAAGSTEGATAAFLEKAALPPVMQNLLEAAAERWAVAEGGPTAPMTLPPVELDHAGLTGTASANGSGAAAGSTFPGSSGPVERQTASRQEGVYQPPHPSASLRGVQTASHPMVLSQAGPHQAGGYPMLSHRPALNSAHSRQTVFQKEHDQPAEFHRPDLSHRRMPSPETASFRTLGGVPRVDGANAQAEQQAAYPVLQMTYGSPVAALARDLRQAAGTMGLSFPAAEAMAEKAEPESMQTLNQMSQPQIEEQIVWQNPYMRAGPVDTAYRQKPPALRREQPQPRISDAEIRRTADKVFKLVQEKIIAERRRIGRI